MRISGSVRNLCGLADAATDAAAADAGATLYTDSEGNAIMVPGTDPTAPTTFFNTTDPGQLKTALDAMATGVVNLPNAAGTVATGLAKDAYNALPTIPWWVWIGGAGALYVLVRKVLK